METNKELIVNLVTEILNDSHRAMLKDLTKVINSGCIDIENWDRTNNSMVLPKIIATAILQHQSTQYEGKGTSFQKKIKKEVKNIRYFL